MRGKVRRRQSRREFLTRLGLLALGAAGGPHVSARKVNASVLQLKFGNIPIASNIGIYLADDLGYLKERDITIKYERIDSAAKAAASLGTGDLDGAGGGVGASTFNAVGRGLGIKLVADKSLFLPGVPNYGKYLVRKDKYESGIKTFKDLKGLKLAINAPGSVTDYELGKPLAEAGLELGRDVELVTMPFPAMVTALETRAIDGCFEVEPFATKAIKTGVAVAIADAGETLPFFQVAHVMLGEKFIQRNREAAFAFVEAYLMGLRKYYASGPYSETVLQSLVRHTPLKLDVIREIAPVWFDINGDVRLQSLEATQNWFMKRGFMSEKVSLDSMVDTVFIRKAQAALGRLENPGKPYWEKVKPA